MAVFVKWNFLLACLFITLLITIYLGLVLLCSDTHCQCNESNDRRHAASAKRKVVLEGTSPPHVMAVLVPFRDRFEELMVFVPHLSRFLHNQGRHFKIYVLNQVDDYRFNRASLINVGFLEARSVCDHIAMHDVDLLPINEQLDYRFPGMGPFHVAAPHLHPTYHYETFVGGILLIRNEHFDQLNGMSNRYWGWGREDDEFYIRMKKAKLEISRPARLTTGQNSFRHVHDRRHRPRDNLRYFDQKEKTKRLDRETGLSTVQYRIDSRKEMTIDGFPVTIINIILHCNTSMMPWCLPAEEHSQYLKSVSKANSSVIRKGGKSS